MKREKHLKVDKFFWDEEYNEVHKWMDSSFPKYVGRNPYRHWLEHHHMKAIKEKYGSSINYNVAYLHILSDYLSHFGIAFVPKDKEDAEKRLKDIGVI